MSTVKTLITVTAFVYVASICAQTNVAVRPATNHVATMPVFTNRVDQAIYLLRAQRALIERAREDANVELSRLSSGMNIKRYTGKPTAAEKARIAVIKDQQHMRVIQLERIAIMLLKLEEAKPPHARTNVTHHVPYSR
jgi:hypothetical protein